MSIKDDKKEENDKAEIDFGIGKISFGGLFQGIGSVIDLVSKMEEEGKGETGRVKAVYGFSINSSVGGKPIDEPQDYQISPYENVPPGDKIKVIFTEKSIEQINPNIK